MELLVADMDYANIIQHNRDRWEDLARNNVLFSRPWLNLDESTARLRLDPIGGELELNGKKVLCLASGGGQQSAAFSVLGAEVVVLDYSEIQLERDRQTAAIYGYRIRTVHGDMRDLSSFEEDAFDIVWQPPSINYVREATAVIGQVARVLRKGGFYFLEFSNPMAMGPDERSWTSDGYPLKRFYIDGEVIEYDRSEWEVWNENGTCRTIEGPKQFRHSLSTIFNTLYDRGFVVRRFWERVGDATAEPGTWAHFGAIAPPILGVWCQLTK